MSDPSFPAVRWWSKNDFEVARNQLWACMAMNSLILLPIVLSVPLYLDDYSRAAFGVFGWARDARPLAEILYLGLNLGKPLVAASPLYQLISLVILSVTCVVAVRAYRIESPWLGALAALPMVGQPYFLANLSFGFDSASMSLAQLFAISAAVVLLSSRALISCGLAWMLLVAALLTYQPSASSFLAFGLMFALASAAGLVDRSTRSSWAQNLFKIVLCYSLALVFIAAFVRFAWKEKSAYAANASRVINLDLSAFSSLAKNVAAFFGIYLDDWSVTPLLLIIGALALTYLAFTFVSWSRALLVFASLVLILAVSPGAVLLLANPQSANPRTLVFIGPLLGSLCLQVAASLLKIKARSRFLAIVGILPIGLLAWFLVLFSFSYGSAAHAQEQFVAGRISRLAAAVSSLEAAMPSGNRLKSISYVGGMPRSIILQNTVRRYPLIDRLVFRIIQNNNDIGTVMMSAHGFPALVVESPLPKDLDDSKCRTKQVGVLCSSEFIAEVRGSNLRLRIR